MATPNGRATRDESVLTVGYARFLLQQEAREIIVLSRRPHRQMPLRHHQARRVVHQRCLRRLWAR